MMAPPRLVRPPSSPTSHLLQKVYLNDGATSPAEELQCSDVDGELATLQTHGLGDGAKVDICIVVGARHGCGRCVKGVGSVERPCILITMLLVSWAPVHQPLFLFHMLSTHGLQQRPQRSLFQLLMIAWFA